MYNVKTSLVAVSDYINNYVIQSYVWDNSDVKTRTKAVNRAEMTLRAILGDVFDEDPIPTNILGEQTIWILKLDDTIERAELGMKNVWVDGTMITVTERDNSICPLVYKLLGIAVTSKGTRRRVGGYNHPVGGTNRMGSSVLLSKRNRARRY